MRWYWWTLIIISIVVAAALLNRNRVMKDLAKIQLSENFTADEFVVTGSGVENVPGEKEIECLRQLCINILQPLRDFLDKPIYINSGYRSPAVNAVIIGASKTSQHMKGQAADFYVEGMTVQQVIDVIRQLRLPYDQLIDELRGSGNPWVHVSYNPDKAPRYQWMTRRDPGPSRPNEYETVKIGLAA